MVEWFLLNGVDGQGTWPGIHFADEYALAIASTATDARPAVGNAAVMRTEKALHSVALKPPIISAFVCFHQNTMAS